MTTAWVFLLTLIVSSAWGQTKGINLVNPRPAVFDSVLVIHNGNLAQPYLLTSALTIQPVEGVNEIRLVHRSAFDVVERWTMSPAQAHRGGLRWELVAHLTPIPPGTPSSHASTFTRLRTGLSVQATTERDAQLFIEGEAVGQGSVVLALAPGRYRFEAEDAAGRRRGRTVLVGSGPVQHIHVPLAPSAVQYAIRAPFPGLPQWSQRARGRALAVGAGTLLAATGVGVAFDRERTAHRRYDDAREAYARETRPDMLPALRADAERRLATVETRQRDLQTAWTLAAGVYAVHLLDTAWGARRLARRSAPVLPVVAPDGRVGVILSR